MAITPGGRVGDASPLGKGPRKLSDYEREVARALLRRGVRPKSRAIAMARGIIDRAATTGRWGRGKKASPNVVAGAVASVAQRKAFVGEHKLANEPRYRHGWVPLDADHAAIAAKMADPAEAHAALAHHDAMMAKTPARHTKIRAAHKAAAAIYKKRRQELTAQGRLFANSGATITGMDFLFAVLDKSARDALATSEFAIPETRSYPIPDAVHARVALAMVKMHGTPEEQAKVRAAVKRKFPQISMSNEVRDLVLAEAAERGMIDLGRDGAKWKHGWIPLNAVAAAIKAKKFHGGSSGGSRSFNVGDRVRHANGREYQVMSKSDTHFEVKAVNRFDSSKLHSRRNRIPHDGENPLNKHLSAHQFSLARSNAPTSGKSRINVGAQAEHALAPKGKSKMTAVQRARGEAARRAESKASGNVPYFDTSKAKVQGGMYSGHSLEAARHLEQFKPGDRVVVHSKESGKEHVLTVNRSSRGDGGGFGSAESHTVGATFGPGRYTYNVTNSQLTTGKLNIRHATPEEIRTGVVKSGPDSDVSDAHRYSPERGKAAAVALQEAHDRIIKGHADAAEKRGNLNDVPPAHMQAVMEELAKRRTDSELHVMHRGSNTRESKIAGAELQRRHGPSMTPNEGEKSAGAAYGIDPQKLAEHNAMRLEQYRKSGGKSDPSLTPVQGADAAHRRLEEAITKSELRRRAARLNHTTPDGFEVKHSPEFDDRGNHTGYSVSIEDTQHPKGSSARHVAGGHYYKGSDNAATQAEIAALGRARDKRRGGKQLDDRYTMQPREVASNDSKARTRITKKTYRGEDGHLISGTDTKGRKVSVFAPGDRSAAEKARANIHAGKGPFEPASQPQVSPMGINKPRSAALQRAQQVAQDRHRANEAKRVQAAEKVASGGSFTDAKGNKWTAVAGTNFFEDENGERFSRSYIESKFGSLKSTSATPARRTRRSLDQMSLGELGDLAQRARRKGDLRAAARYEAARQQKLRGGGDTPTVLSGRHGDFNAIAALNKPVSEETRAKLAASVASSNDKTRAAQEAAYAMGSRVTVGPPGSEKSGVVVGYAPGGVKVKMDESGRTIFVSHTSPQMKKK